MTSNSNGFLQPPLAARNGRQLKILAICRISTANQDERSLADQEAVYREWVARHTDLTHDIEVIASRGSGECLDRAEYHRAIELVESSRFDLVITEDLGRICRRVHAHIFCETCEDHETRLIAINDSVDTERDDWRLGSFFAVMRHESYNRDTSQRIRRSLRNRFSQGGVVQTTIFGYIKPPGTSTDDALQKDSAVEPIYDEWFRRLEDGATFAEISDWLNDRGVPTGPYARTSRWSGTMVGQVTRNPLLKGLRVRNRRMARRVNSTGRHKSVIAPPEELLERDCHHLAFIETARYDRVMLLLQERNAGYRRHRVNGRDPRQNVPRRRTRWPGQHIFCGICGRMFVYGGHGQTDHLMCSGAREHQCWNGITVDGPLAARQISEAVFREIEALEDFDGAFLRLVEEQARQANTEREAGLRELAAETARNERQLANVAQFIREGSHSPTIRAELEQLEREKSELEYRMSELASRPVDDLVIPTAEELRHLACREFGALALESVEFARLMRCLIPRVVVFPHRLCDGGHIVLRSRFRLCLAGLLPDQNVREVLASPLERILTVDLFEPCQRAAFREQIVALRATINPETGRKYTEADAARDVGITTTAAQRAAALQRTMDQLGLSDPFVPVLEPPEDYTKLRRHQHRRYSFEPLEEAGQL